MIFRAILLLVSLSLAGIVAYASVFGFMVIFAGAPYFAAAMGGFIEAAKLVGISFLYRYKDGITRKFRYSLLTVTVMTFLLSAIGVFGFLSKSHLESNTPLANNTAQLEFIDNQIQTNEIKISSAKDEIESLNAEVNKLIEFDKVSGPNGSKATREKQQPRRDQLNQIITTANETILQLRNDKLGLTQEVNTFEAKIGPIRYVAELFWDIDDTTNQDKAIRLLIILVMFVFDPFAILLLIGYNHTVLNKGRKTEVEIEQTVNIETNFDDIVTDEEIDDIVKKIADEKDQEPIEESEEDTVEVEEPKTNMSDEKLDKLTEMVVQLSDGVKKQQEENELRNKIKSDIRKSAE